MSRVESPDRRKDKEKSPQSTTVEQEIYRIKRENNNILANIITLEGEERAVVHSKSESLRQLAKNYERLRELGEFKGEVNDICSAICELLRTKQLNASVSLAQHVLDKKYMHEEFGHSDGNFDEILKQSENNEQKEYFTTGTTYPDQHPYYHSNETASGEMQPTYDEPNKYVQIDYLLKHPQKSIDEMNVDEIRETTENMIDMEKQLSEQHRELRRRKKEFQEKCLQEKIALSPDYEFNRDAHISTPVDVTGISEAWEALEELKIMLGKVQDKLYKFKPEPAMAKKMATAIREEVAFWKPMADEKYRKDQLSWWMVEMDNLWSGKHAAATMHGTKIDDKIMRALAKDRVDASSITPELRALLEEEGIIKKNLTREQVGDKAKEVVQRAIRFAAAQRMKYEFYNWYIVRVEPKIGIRAANLHDTLSEKSFT